MTGYEKTDRCDTIKKNRFYVGSFNGSKVLTIRSLAWSVSTGYTKATQLAPSQN